MTAEKLQDAITLLPGDLVAATDRLRTAPQTRVFYWKPVLTTAACFLLLLSAGFVFQRTNRMSAKTESAAAAPMAPQIMMDEAPAAEAAPEAPAADTSAMGVPTEEIYPELPSDVGAPEVPYEEIAGSENGMKEELYVDHSHRFAEPEEEAMEVPSGYSGHYVTKVYADGQEYELRGADSAAMTDILSGLNYDPDAVCRCMAEFTVDTELLTGIAVNLKEAFARCEKGQAALTEEQVTILREIIDNLQ